MKILEKLLALSLCVSTASFVVACDVDDDDADGGMGGEGGAVGGAGGDVGGAGGGGVETTYNYLIIIDNSIDENMAGTPGADICGIEIDCAVSIVDTDFVQGEGMVCEMEGDGCSTARNEPGALNDDGNTCEPASVPSDYVSLGMAGAVAVQYDGDLRGCSIAVRELVGNDSESYQVQVCADATSTDCLVLDGEATTLSFEDGGEGTFSVPEADMGGEGGAGGAGE